MLFGQIAVILITQMLRFRVELWAVFRTGYRRLWGASGFNLRCSLGSDFGLSNFKVYW